MPNLELLKQHNDAIRALTDERFNFCASAACWIGHVPQVDERVTIAWISGGNARFLFEGKELYYDELAEKLYGFDLITANRLFTPYGQEGIDLPNCGNNATIAEVCDMVDKFIERESVK